MESEGENPVNWETDEDDHDAMMVTGDVLVLTVQQTGIGGSKRPLPEADNSQLSVLLKRARGTTKIAGKSDARLSYDNTTALNRHKASLGRALVHLQRLSEMASESVMCAWVLSVFPEKFTEKSSYQPFVSPLHLQQLFDWISGCFKPNDFHRDQACADDDASDDADIVKRIIAATKLENQFHLGCKEICFVAVALLRLMGVKTRIVRTVDPPSSRGKDHADLFEQAVREFQRTKGSAGAGSGAGAGAGAGADASAEASALTSDLVTLHGNKGKMCLSPRYFVEIFQVKHTTRTATSTQPTSASSSSVAAVDGTKLDRPIIISDNEDTDFERRNRSSRRVEVVDRAWIHCDPTANKVNAPHTVVDELRRNRNVEYCIACDEEGYMADVTARYEKSPQATAAIRCGSIQSWWSSQLDERNSRRVAAATKTTTGETQAGGYSGSNGGGAALFAKHEEQEFLRKKKSQPLPKSLKELKDHPLFVVEDCEEAPLKLSECINPNKKRENFKGIVASKKCYLRDVVEECKTRNSWKKALRQVLDEVVPCKAVPKKGRDGQVYTREFFGHWQTTQYILEKVANGKIPTNAHDNVEVWDGCEDLVPTGAKFLPLSPLQTIELMRKTATMLGIHFKDALTGFEFRGGTRQPKLGGLVVLEEHCDIMRNALAQIKTNKEEEQRQKRENEIIQRWSKLVRCALSRQNLKELYGH